MDFYVHVMRISNVPIFETHPEYTHIDNQGYAYYKECVEFIKNSGCPAANACTPKPGDITLTNYVENDCPYAVHLYTINLGAVKTLIGLHHSGREIVDLTDLLTQYPILQSDEFFKSTNKLQEPIRVLPEYLSKYIFKGVRITYLDPEGDMTKTKYEIFWDIDEALFINDWIREGFPTYMGCTKEKYIKYAERYVEQHKDK